MEKNVNKITIFLVIMLSLTSCQISKKRRERLKKQTVIDNPFEIKPVETRKFEPGSKKDSSKDEKQISSDDKTFHEQGPSAVTSSKNKKTVAQNTTPKKSAPVKPTKAEEKKNVVETNKKLEQEKMIQNYPFKVGEKITYSIRYFALEAGKFTFEVKPFKEINNRKVFHFYISARTSSIFAWVYKLKDYAESFWDVETQRPYLMKIYGNESRFIREVQTTFDWDRKQARYQAKIMEVGKGLDEEDKTWALTDKSAQDVVSAIYYLRTEKLQVGKIFNFSVAERGKNIPLRATVIREEMLKTSAGNFQTYVVQPTFSTNGNWKQKGDITIWLTKDERKVPIQFEAKIKVGTIRGRLHSLHLK